MPVTALDPRYPIGEYAPQPFSIPRKVEWLADTGMVAGHYSR